MPERTINPGAPQSPGRLGASPPISGLIPAGWVPARSPSFWVARLLPYLPWLLVAFLSFVLLAVFGVLVWMMLGLTNPMPGPGPGPDDARFVTIGREYVPHLGEQWGRALDKGAEILEAGQPVAMANETVAKELEKNRLAGLHQYITPYLEEIIPKGMDEKDITPEKRARLARAYRAAARGAEGK